MKTILSLFFVSSFAALAADKAPTAEALLADTIARPGSYSQLCEPPQVVSQKIPLPLFQSWLLREINVSDERLAALKARRAEVIPALKKLIAAIEPAQTAPRVAPLKMTPTASEMESAEILSSGISPREINGLLMDIVLNLEAVEVLPEMLQLEERLRAALERADHDPKAPAPNVANDGSFWLGKPAELSERDKKMIRGRIAQRELLSVMLQLLRRQRFQPMLDSEFEQVYATAIKKEAGDSLEGIRQNSKPWVQHDPIYRIQLKHIAKQPSVPFSREVREKVRALVGQYIKSATAELRKPSAAA